jgi:hypothetical protein
VQESEARILSTDEFWFMCKLHVSSMTPASEHVCVTLKQFRFFALNCDRRDGATKEGD